MGVTDIHACMHVHYHHACMVQLVFFYFTILVFLYFGQINFFSSTVWCFVWEPEILPRERPSSQKVTVSWVLARLMFSSFFVFLALRVSFFLRPISRRRSDWIGFTVQREIVGRLWENIYAIRKNELCIVKGRTGSLSASLYLCCCTASHLML